MHEFGKIIIVVGVLFVVLGIGVILAPRIPFLGKLPGDLHWEGKYGSFYFPIVTCVVLSILFSIILNLFFRR